MNKLSKIYIAGHNGMVGSAIKRNLTAAGYVNIITRELEELDLRNQSQVEKFFIIENPDVVIIAAAKVGGILANNTYRAEFIYDNLMIETNLIHASYKYGAGKVVFLGSSCIYPKLARQPIKEEELLNGYLEFTNEPYAIAKIAGIKMCESYYRQYGSNFISIMPCNLYGPNDNFNPETSHVLPALIRKFHEAAISYPMQEEVVVWGTGKPEREFLYVDDLADAVRFLMEKVNAADIYEKGISHINAGYGKDVTIARLAEIVADVAGFKGKIIYDTAKPDGTPKKLMDSSRINSLGWQPKVILEEGIARAYKWFVENHVLVHN